MAVTDPYAQAADYHARVPKAGIGDDATIDAQLAAVSRLIDRACFDGRSHFTKDVAAVARVYDGNGGRLLGIDNLVSASSVKVDMDLDGTFETDLAAGVYHLVPLNADKGSEPRPYTGLQLVRYNGTLDVWPAYDACVEVTGIFGWPAVPGFVVERCILIVREIRDTQESGPALTLQDIDAAIQLRPQARRYLAELVDYYGRRSLFV